MKWFKHDSNASIDAKIERVILKYGLEGYGLYFYCLEMIARTVEKHNLSFELEHDAELIANRVGMHHEKVQEMMKFMVDLNLFENDRGVITCLKMATRTDEYTQKLIKEQEDRKSLDKLPIVSRQTPDSVGIKSELKEENRREETDKSIPYGISPEWEPNKNNVKWMQDSGMSEIEQRRVVRDFRDFWIQSKSKKANWDLAFRKNPIVNRAVNQNHARPKENYGKGGI